MYEEEEYMWMFEPTTIESKGWAYHLVKEH